MSTRHFDASAGSFSQRVRIATADLIDAHGPFDVFVTWTLGYDLGELSAHDLLHRHLIRVAQLSGQHFGIAWSWGRQDQGRMHFHALVRGLVQPLDDDYFLRTGWPGDVRPEWPCDDVGAALYLARRNHPRWALGTVCTRRRPCRRKKGCVVGAAPWPRPAECVLAWS